jgi:hypothetical protein
MIEMSKKEITELKGVIGNISADLDAGKILDWYWGCERRRTTREGEEREVVLRLVYPDLTHWYRWTGKRIVAWTEDKNAVSRGVQCIAKTELKGVIGNIIADLDAGKIQDWYWICEQRRMRREGEERRGALMLVYPDLTHFLTPVLRGGKRIVACRIDKRGDNRPVTNWTEDKNAVTCAQCIAKLHEIGEMRNEIGEEGAN